MHNHLSYAFNITIKLKQVLTIPHQRNNQTSHYPCPAPCSGERDSRSGEPPSPRRGLEKASPPCLSEIVARSKQRRFVEATTRAEKLKQAPASLA